VTYLYFLKKSTKTVVWLDKNVDRKPVDGKWIEYWSDTDHYYVSNGCVYKCDRNAALGDYFDVMYDAVEKLHIGTNPIRITSKNIDMLIKEMFRHKRKNKGESGIYEFRDSIKKWREKKKVTHIVIVALGRQIFL